MPEFTFVAVVTVQASNEIDAMQEMNDRVNNTEVYPNWTDLFKLERK